MLALALPWACAVAATATTPTVLNTNVTVATATSPTVLKTNVTVATATSPTVLNTNVTVATATSPKRHNKAPPPPAPPGLIWRAGANTVHFYRIPKSGSTTLLSLLPRLKCESVIVHNHADGCKHLGWCNGSMLEGVLKTQPVFVTVRHVYSRLESQWLHMLTKDPDRFRDCKTLEQFVQLLETWTSGCPGGSEGVHCKVLAINRHYNKTHRVILWPQAFYMAPRTMPICYHPDFLEERIQNRVEALTLCRGLYQPNIDLYKNVRARANKTTPSRPASKVYAAAQRLYDEDDRIWHRYCSTSYDRRR